MSTKETKTSNTYTSKPDLEPAAENPFLPDLITSTAGKIKSRNAGRVMKSSNGFISETRGLHDPATGEILENETLVIAMKKAVDTEEFTKVFTAATTAFYDLSKRAIDVFTTLIKSYNSGKLSGTNDLIFFTFQ